ncbi:tetratricopeptide repeat protein [Flavobacterium sp. LT1R49]|uniref:tetratricopeptide repeat protein n=1 Tax=Flavobacterium arabinosi TaxID=3398737 RepID=UPI003A89D5A8
MSNFLGAVQRAQELLLKAYILFGQLKGPLYKAKVSDLIGTNYGYMGSPKESLKFYMEALTIAKNHKDSLLLSTISSNLGIYHRKVNPSIAINYYKKSLSYIPKGRKCLDRI